MIETWFNQDLQGAVQVRTITGNFFSLDNSGNKIGVRVTNGGEPVELDGTISANVIRQDGTTVAVPGDLDGNEAWVILPQTCYAVPGVIYIVIKNTVGTSITTLCAVAANVYQSSTDSVVDPGSLIPSVQNLIASIQETLSYVPSEYNFTSSTMRNELGFVAPACEIGTINTQDGTNAAGTGNRVRSTGYLPMGVAFQAKKAIKVIAILYDENFDHIGSGQWRELDPGRVYIPAWEGATWLRFVLSYIDDTQPASPYELTERITILQYRALQEGDDLNDCLSTGNYFSPSDAVTGTLLNCPIKLYSFSMKVEQVSIGVIRQTIYQGTSASPTMVRQYMIASDRFNPWRTFSTKNELTVMSYNLCYYNNNQGGTGYPPEILDEKVQNLKVLLMENAPDIIGIQEDTEFIDQVNTIPSDTALFKPIWPYNAGGKYTQTIKSKYGMLAGTGEKIWFDEPNNSSGFRRGIFLYEASKKILFISMHARWGASDAEDTIRMGNYVTLFQHINDSADEWDYCIVVGDFNTATDTSKAKLAELCEDNNFKMAIGTYLPWTVKTRYNEQGQPSSSLDNILVSGNIDFVTTKVFGDQYPLLYSDHVPLIARLRLN